MKPVLLALAFALSAGSVGAQPREEVVGAIDRFTAAVNRGDFEAARTAFSPSPTITEDLAPFHWGGEGAVGAWMAAMGANAGRMKASGISMQISPASRVEVEGGRAYAVVPGVLTYSFLSAPPQRAGGTLTFSLSKVGTAWRIDTMTWTGERLHP